MRRKYLSINSKKLAFFDEGNPHGPVILFGHSYFFDASMWENQIRYFIKKGYRCIAPDLWAHGESDLLLEDSYSIEAIAYDYRVFLDTLNISAACVVGISVGGMWATRLALDNPDRIDAVVIMDSYVGSEEPSSQVRFFSLLKHFKDQKHISPELSKIMIPMFFSENAISRKEKYVEDFENYLLSIPASHVNSLAALGYGIFGRNSMLDQLDQLSSIPCLVIVGEQDQPRPPSEAKEMASLLGATCEIIQNAGHIANLEEPEQVNNLLNNFLEQLHKNTSALVH